MTGGLWSAEILDALGKPDAAATLRWGFPGTWPELVDELDETRTEALLAEDDRDGAREELKEARGDLTRLEALLCKDCRKAWEGAGL